jgi:hypothetical protein
VVDFTQAPKPIILELETEVWRRKRLAGAVGRHWGNCTVQSISRPLPRFSPSSYNPVAIIMTKFRVLNFKNCCNPNETK